MSQQYYIRRDGQVHGPCSREKLLKLTDSKKLRGADELAQSEDGPWFLARHLVERLRSGEELILTYNSSAVSAAEEPEEEVAQVEVVEAAAEADVEEEYSLTAEEEAELQSDDNSAQQLPKKRKTAKRRAVRRNSSLGTSLVEFWEVYGLVLKPLLVASIVLAIGAFVFYRIIRATKSDAAWTQQEFAGRTTHMWLELERDGKARHQEVLWQDGRWAPLEQFISLDWEATGDLLEAVADDRTRNLAEGLLGRYQSTTPGPKPALVLPNLTHESPLVRLWAARVASRTPPELRDDIMPALEKATKDPDPEVAAAAAESIKQLSQPST